MKQDEMKQKYKKQFGVSTTITERVKISLHIKAGELPL
jgi:hypothetical protein